MAKIKFHNSNLCIVLTALVLITMFSPIIPVAKSEASTSKETSFHTWDFEDVTSVFNGTSGWINESEGPSGAGLYWNKMVSTNKLEIVEDNGSKVLKATVSEYCTQKPRIIVYAKNNSTNTWFKAGDKVTLSYKVKLARLYNGNEVGFAKQADETTYTDRLVTYFSSARTPNWADGESLGVKNGQIYAGGAPNYVSSECIKCNKTGAYPSLANANNKYAEVKLEVDTSVSPCTWKAYYKVGNYWVSAKHNLFHDFVSEYVGENVQYFYFDLSYTTTYNKTEFANEKLVYYFDDIRVSVNDGKPSAEFMVNGSAITLKTEADIKTEALKNAIVLKDSAGSSVAIGSVTKIEGGYAINPATDFLPNMTYTISIPENKLMFTGAWSDTYVNGTSKSFIPTPFSIDLGAKGVNVNTKTINVSFGDKIDVTTLQNSDIIVKDSEGKAVSSTVTAFSTGIMAQVKLLETLKPHAKYTIEIQKESINFAQDASNTAFAGKYLDAKSSYFYTGNPDDFYMGTDFEFYEIGEEATLAALQRDFAVGTNVGKDVSGNAGTGGTYTVKATQDGKLEMYSKYVEPDNKILRTNLFFRAADEEPIKGATKMTFDVMWVGNLDKNCSTSANPNSPVMEILSGTGTKLYGIYRTGTNGYYSFWGSDATFSNATQFKDANGVDITYNNNNQFKADTPYHFEITTSADGKTATCVVYENGVFMCKATATSAAAEAGFGRARMGMWPINNGVDNVQHRVYDNISFSALGKKEAYLVNGTTGVSAEGDDLVIGFATPVNEADIDGKITLDGEVADGTLSEDGYFYTLDKVNLELEKEYTITIAQIADYFGNDVSAKTITFKTEKNPEKIVVCDYTIKDADGTVTEIKPNQKLTISATFTNNGGTPANATLFIALYDKYGNMIRVAGDANNVLLEDGSGSVTHTATFKAPSDLASGAYIKIFAWSYTNASTPYTSEVIFPAQ